MDINDHFKKIVEELTASVTLEVTKQVDSVIANSVNARLATYDFSSHIREAATLAFEKKASEYQIDQKKLESRIAEKIESTINEVQANTRILVSESVNNHIAKTDFNHSLTNAVEIVLNDKLTNFDFPQKSIPFNAINLDNVIITGDMIDGGIVSNFSSVGIEDRASSVALTILDDVTVVENNLLTKDLTVEGSMTINGSFIVNGDIPSESNFFKELVNRSSSTVLTNVDSTMFDRYSDVVFNKIKKDGLDLNKIKLNGTEIVTSNKLSPTITESNLQKFGLIKEMQVEGESIFSQTLYVTNKRIGINTIEPSATLSIWDDEIEVVIMKKQKETAFLGTPRQQKMILSSNNKDNIVLETDGSVSMSQIQLGTMKFSTGSSPPNFVSTRGHVVWNTNPNLGGPLGWVCLGEARWANFGIID